MVPTPDARTRQKINLRPARVLTTSHPNKLLLMLFLSNVVFVTLLHTAKVQLLSLHVGIFWVVMRVLTCGGLGALFWEGWKGNLRKKELEWSILAMSSFFVVVQQISLFTALHGLSVTRVILFSQMSSLWIYSILKPDSAGKPIALGLAFLVSFMSDCQFSSAKIWPNVPAYSAIIIHALSSSALEQINSILYPSLGINFTAAASVVGACLFALPLYLLRSILLGSSSAPILPILSLTMPPFLAYSIFFLSPKTARAFTQLSSERQYFQLSYPSLLTSSVVIGSLAFSQFPTWVDFLTGSLLYYGMYPKTIQALVTPCAPTSRIIQSYLKTILSNPESRKIFYFLMLNMAYMLVQMLYGIWTNSLGLISDAIHMAFDCMAIGVGLFASVMATWAPNERFTYGYGRIETLSGFANGIFLILISIFIVFEAIQRILEPPEMNTSQLLLISTMGLVVNLFGIFAMGGHHHPGHTHSHGHSDTRDKNHHSENKTDHSHSHSPSPQHLHVPVDPTSNDLNPRAPSYSASAEDLLKCSSLQSGRRSNSDLQEDNVDVNGIGIESDSHNAFVQKRPIESPGQLKADIHTDVLLPCIPRSQEEILSPLTPSYHFGRDDHFQAHHRSDHTPNLHDHSHLHGHSRERHSHNMRGVFLHVLADTLGSVGVIISTLLIQLYGWTGFDPIASLFIAILIAASVIPLVLDAGKVLALDVADRDRNIQQALAELASVEGLMMYKLPRFWPKDSSSLIGSVHLQMASSYHDTGPEQQDTKMDFVVERVDTLLRSQIAGLEELTIQVENQVTVDE